MFWNANHSSPSIDTILAKEDLKLGEVLDHETIFQDLRGQNQKLLDYITRADVLNDLVTLVTEEPSLELAENERYKWPNAACEVLTTNMFRLNENLSEKVHLVKLFSFFENDPPLNPLLSSFVSRALSVLISRKVDQHWYSYQLTCLRVLEFLKSSENSSQLLIKHLGTSAVMDLLLKFLTQIEGGDMQQNLLDWIESVHLVENIVALFHPSVDADRQGNAAQLLCDTIEKLRINEKETTPLNQTILDHIQSPEIVKKILENMLDQEEKSDGSITGGITVLLALLDPSAVTGTNDEKPGSGDATYLNPAPIISEIVPYLPKFHDLLINPPKKDPIKLSCGVIDPPLGIIRLSVIKLISTLIASNTPQVNEMLDKLNTVQVLLDLFFHYTWNSFLHSEVDKCLAFALSAPIKDRDNPLLINVFVKCRLIQRIIEAWEENEKEQGNGGKRRGYMGHLTNIANSIVECGGDLDAFLNERVDPETMDSWRNYINASLQPINELHQKFLGGHHPAQSNQTNSQSEYNTVDFSNEADLANSSIYNDVFDFDKDDVNEEMLEKDNPFAGFWTDKDLEEMKQSFLLDPEEAEPWSQAEKCDTLNEGWANFNDQDFGIESPKNDELPDDIKAQIESNTFFTSEVETKRETGHNTKVEKEGEEEKIVDPVILDDKCEIDDPLNKSDNNANLNSFIKGNPHEEELIDNFRFLSHQGMMSETPEVPQSETVTPSEKTPAEDGKPETPQDPV